MPAKAPSPAGEAASLSPFIDWTCRHLGCEAEPASVAYDQVPALLWKAAPALLRLRLAVADGERDAGECGFLALLGCRRGRARLLASSGRVIEVPVDELRAELCREVEAAHGLVVERLLDTVGIEGAGRERARRALLARRLAGAPLRGVWLLREPSSVSFTNRLMRAGVGGRLAALAATHVLHTALWIVAWWLIGKALLEGNLPEGWIGAWLLLLATLVPLRLLTVRLQGDIAVRAGGATKERVYAGALKLDPDEVKRRGVGQLAGSVLESEAVEALALSGGFLALLGGIELLFALAVLSVGAASFAHPVALAAVVVTALTLAWLYARDRRAWTDRRLAMTHALIEKIVGHRTRTVQEPAEQRHREEDQSLEAYARLSGRLDRRAVLLLGLVPRGWLVVALALLAPAFVQGASTASLAVALGGALLAHRALARGTTGLASLADAAISWREVKPMLDAARLEDSPGARPPGPAASSDGDAILVARNMRYAHRGRFDSVLEGCSLKISSGEQVLVSGASGSGKSTLLSVLSGLRAGQDGLALLEGRDAKTTGLSAWRARVGAVLQLHDDHLFSAPFRFNLAAGHHWPPSSEDMRQAASLCRDLSLDGLLERMPGRFDQVVGEGGWRLSHGERARLSMARALLRMPRLLVADESFEALDGQTQRQVLEATRRRVPALLVVGHG